MIGAGAETGLGTKDTKMKEPKAQHLVSDAGPLISLAENCLLWTIRGLQNPILIPKTVEYEAVIRPLKINKYEFNAMRIREMIREGEVIVDPLEIRTETNEILSLANRLLFRGNRPLTILHQGEAEVLALALRRGLSTILIDERTARLVVEDVWQIKKYMESRLGIKLEMKEKVAHQLEDMFSGFDVLRSSEIIAFCYENGFLADYGVGIDVLKAALYAAKRSGCAITHSEIDEYMQVMPVSTSEY